MVKSKPSVDNVSALQFKVNKIVFFAVVCFEGPVETLTTSIYVLTVENYVIDGTPVRACYLREKLRFHKIDCGGLPFY